MPVPTPLHSRTQQLCASYLWKDWAGYYSVRSYDVSHDREYFAIRHGAGIFDLTPLFKYKVSGPDAANFLSFMMTRNIHKLEVGRVGYTCWCDEMGKIIDDGTVMNHGDNTYFFTAAIPSFSWFKRYQRGFNVEIEDITENYSIIGIQGPKSRDLIANFCDDVGVLKFFRFTNSKIANTPIILSRTGYTGDLGYEIWIENKDATKVWDSLLTISPMFAALPAGLDALDVTRVEAGFIMNGVDYFSAHHCPIEDRKSSPFEIGLGWVVHFDKDFYLGKKFLEKEKKSGSTWSLYGVEYDWDEYEKVYQEFGLPPELCSKAWRMSIPIYDPHPKQIGYATSGTWSPILKKNIALATLKTEFAQLGKRVAIEVTVEHQRRTVGATLVKTPFFNPERKMKP